MANSDDKLKNLREVKDAALSCVHCGECRAVVWPQKNIYYICPVYKTDITPKFEVFNSRGKNIILKGLLWGDLDLSAELAEIVNQCSLCGACEEFCHNTFNENINFANHKWTEQVKVFEALRADLVEAGYALEEHIPMNEALAKMLNPYGKDQIEKAKWTERLDFEVKDASKESAVVLYFVGCTAALTPKIQDIAVATAQIFKKAGIDFAVFKEKEICCGSVAMRTGDRKVFDEIAKLNTDLFKERGIEQIITSCAGCYRTLKKDYAEKLEGIEVLHTVEFLEKMIENNLLNLKKLDVTTTYHDPCHLGRHMDVYESPRKILEAISNFSEMQTTKNTAMCCGAGGGVRKGFPELSLEMAKNRIKEAEATGAKYLVSTCPFCYRNLSDAIELLKSDIEMVDLVELILMAMD